MSKKYNFALYVDMANDGTYRLQSGHHHRDYAIADMAACIRSVGKYRKPNGAASGISSVASPSAENDSSSGVILVELVNGYPGAKLPTSLSRAEVVQLGKVVDQGPRDIRKKGKMA